MINDVKMFDVKCLIYSGNHLKLMCSQSVKEKEKREYINKMIQKQMLLLLIIVMKMNIYKLFVKMLLLQVKKKGFEL